MIFLPDYTPQNDELKAAVEREGTHTMSGSDLLVPTEEAQLFCGVIYLTVALFDLRNANRGISRRSGQLHFSPPGFGLICLIVMVFVCN